jgi:hypothetical protein
VDPKHAERIARGKTTHNRIGIFFLQDPPCVRGHNTIYAHKFQFAVEHEEAVIAQVAAHMDHVVLSA